MTENVRRRTDTIASRGRSVRLAACLALAAAALMAAAWRSEAAGLLVADGGFGGVLEVESHRVVVTINNGVAVTEVTQVFRNTEPRRVEALYTFPVPKGASVADFSMWINGKEMVGEVVEKQRARRIYESYKRTRRDPGLLEQTDYKTFQMRVFPIGPRAKQTVKIRYYQQLDCDDDWATYVYPLATVSHGKAGSRTTGAFALMLHAKSKVPIAAMESPSHKKDFVMVKHTDHYCQASLETARGDLNRDVVVAYRLSRPQTGLDMICSKIDGEDGYFRLTLTAGKELAGRAEPMDYVFILDISGSMANESKLAISRDCIGEFVDQLGQKDRLEIITFNVRPSTLFNELRPAGAEAKKRARRFLASRKAAGGTVLRPALTAAYRYRDPDRPLNVVIFSDGMTEQSERTALVGAIRDRPPNARVFCVGVGNEVNRPLLGRMSTDAGGLAAFLSRGDDFARQARAFRRKLTRPAMSNVRITFDGAGVYDVEPLKLPNLYHGTPLHLYGRYGSAGPAKITLQAEISGAEFKRTMPVTFPPTDKDNPEIERMWAWHKVQRLLGEGPSAPGARAIEEVVRLGEAYSIATKYTSFIVLENDAEYKRWRIDRRNALRIRRDRDAHRKLLARLETMRSEALAGLGPGGVGRNDEATAGRTAAKSSPQPSPKDRSWNLRFPRLKRPGGGPVGTIGLILIGVLAAIRAVWRRRLRA